MSNKEYEHLQNVLDTAEDIVLGHIARSRLEKSSANDFIAIEKLL